MNVDCQTTYQNIIKNVNDIFRIDIIFRMKIYLDVYVLPLYFGMSTKMALKEHK